MGYSDVGCYGSEIETPALDQLARDGLRFTNFYVDNMCVPTRASLLTGLPARIALDGNTLAPAARTVAEALRNAGYATAMAGKWHLAGTDGAVLPLDRGFERFYGTLLGAGSYFAPHSLLRDREPAEQEWRDDPDYYYTEAITDNAIAFMRETPPEKPLFLYVAFSAPHWPLHARAEDVAKYAGRYDVGWDVLRRQRHARMKALGVIDSSWNLSDRHPDVPPWDATLDRTWQAHRMEVYAVQIDFMDRQVGRIVEALRSENRLVDTLLIYLHDNGASHVEYLPGRTGPFLPAAARDGRPMRIGNRPSVLPGPEDTFQSYGHGWANLSNTPFRLFKSFDHEGGIRSPFIVHWPAGILAPGGIVGDVVHLLDVVPTILDVAGLQRPTELDGRSARALFGGAPRTPATVFWSWANGRAVRKGDWKLVARERGPWELYDLKRDGTETNDLADRSPEQVQELEALWEAWARRTAKGE
jgi:arylsulfatase